MREGKRTEGETGNVKKERAESLNKRELERSRRRGGNKARRGIFEEMTKKRVKTKMRKKLK
jgi:hypothetical protein